MVVRISNIINTMIFIPIVLGSSLGFSQAEWDGAMLRQNETLVSIHKLKPKRGKETVGQGYVFATNDSSIDFLNASKLPALAKSSIPVDQIDLIEWMSREVGYIDRKVTSKYGVTGGLIGAGLGTIGACL
ncbi:MAG: hypothetical protein OEM26_00530 [Saprospiraceae bacterium]|nr:hypothetical protein [Saprospiraceae bacterium]